jgi:hypothetical protein
MSGRSRETVAAYTIGVVSVLLFAVWSCPWHSVLLVATFVGLFRFAGYVPSVF